MKVVDFIIAKLREPATHTQIGRVLGTPGYGSFEEAFAIFDVQVLPFPVQDNSSVYCLHT